MHDSELSAFELIAIAKAVLRIHVAILDRQVFEVSFRLDASSAAIISSRYSHSIQA
jgi:hypothetical protein